MIARLSLVFASLLLAVLVFAQTGQREIPAFPGDDNPAHDGQPLWCQATDTENHKKNCGKCDHKCGEDNDQRCKTWCRSRTACRCNPQCVPTGHMPHKMNKLDPNYREAAR